VSTANAEDSRLLLGGWGKHVPSSDRVTNETHNIIGVELHSIGAGYFKNSYGRDTFYIGKVWREPIAQHLNVAWALGVNYGYRGCFQADDPSKSASLCPHGYIGIEYTKYVIIPSIKWAPGVFIFSPEIRF
jgi:hypothetical protein